MVCFDSILPKYTSALLFSEINPSSERHRELFVGCWSLMTSMGGRSHCNCPGLNNSLWWRSKLNIKKWNAILYKASTYIFALRKTTTTQLAINNIFIWFSYLNYSARDSCNGSFRPWKSLNFSTQQKVLWCSDDGLISEKSKAEVYLGSMESKHTMRFTRKKRAKK